MKLSFFYPVCFLRYLSKCLLITASKIPVDSRQQIHAHEELGPTKRCF